MKSHQTFHSPKNTPTLVCMLGGRARYIALGDLARTSRVPGGTKYPILATVLSRK